MWARAGREKRPSRRCSTSCAERFEKVPLVSADVTEWIADVVAERCENTTQCMYPFHAVQRCPDALNEVRREVWNAVCKGA